MTDIEIKCDAILEELVKFSSDILHLGARITDNRLESFEKKIDFTLPLDFKYIFKAHNGISLSGVEVFGIDKELRGSSLDEVYNYEHYVVNNSMPNEFLPFSPDGRGNHYCLDLSKMESDICPVIFWQHDFIYEDINDVEVCNENFIDWIKEVMIDWTLEDYNYDGTEK